MKVSEAQRRALAEEIRSSVVSEHGVDVHHLVSEHGVDVHHFFVLFCFVGGKYWFWLLAWSRTLPSVRGRPGSNLLVKKKKP